MMVASRRSRHSPSGRAWGYLTGVAAAIGLATTIYAATMEGYQLGRAATEEEIRVWNIDIGPTGEGLPPGQGSATGGASIFAAKCASCHGPTGVEGPADRLVGGQGSLSGPMPLKTVGSYWPYATTLFDYIRRAMPLNAPQSLTPDEVYSLVSWILYQNSIVEKDTLLDAATLPTIRMPNRDGFVSDPRPDVPR